MRQRRFAFFVALTVLIPAVWLVATDPWRFGAVGLLTIWGELAFGFVVDRDTEVNR
jgi:prepilin signal peptidase PulO-like enzyme (type II secretory pathway)